MLASNRYWRLLRTNRDFRRLYAAQLVSFCGDWFLVVPLLGLVLELTGSPLATSGVMAAQMLTIFLFSPFAGAVADRFDRKATMLIADFARAIVCVGFLFVDDLGSVALAYALVALNGIGTAFFYPSSSSALPNLVDREDLAAANVLLGSAWGTMAAIGAALGGVFASTLGRDASFLVDSASFVVSGLLLFGIRRAFAEDRPGRRYGLIESTRRTLRYAWAHPEVAALLTSKGAFGITAGAIVLLPVVSVEFFDAGDAGTGWLFGARGLGALVGPFLVKRLLGGDDRKMMNAIGFAVAAWGLFYVLLAVSPTLAPAIGVVLLAHLGGGTQWTFSSYGLQRSTPDVIRGRIFSFDFALVTLANLGSFVLSGALAEPLGVRTVIVGAGSIAFVFGLAWWRITRRFWDAPAFRSQSFVPARPSDPGAASL